MVQQTSSPSPQKSVRRQSIRVLAKKAVGTPKQKSPKNVVGSAKKTPKQKSFEVSPFNVLKETVENKTPLNKKRKKSKSPSVFNGSSDNKESAELKKSPFVGKEPPSNTPGRTSVGNINKKHSFIEMASPGLQKGLLSSNSTPEMSVGRKKKKQSLSSSFSGPEKTPLGGTSVGKINEKHSVIETASPGLQKGLLRSNSTPVMSVGGKKKKQSLSSSFGGLEKATSGGTSVGNINKKHSFIETASPDLQKGLLSSNSTPEMSVGRKKKKLSPSSSFREKTPLRGESKKQSINSPLSSIEKSIGGQKKGSFVDPCSTPERTSFGGKSKKQSISVNDSSINNKNSNVKSPHQTAKSPLVKTPVKGTVLEVEEAMDFEASKRSSIAVRTPGTSELLSDKELEHAAHIKIQHPPNEKLGLLAVNEIRGTLKKNGIANVQTIKISEPKRKNNLRFGVIIFKDNINLKKFLNLRIPLTYKGVEIVRSKFDFQVKTVAKPSKRPSVVPPRGSPPKKSKKSPLLVVPPKNSKKSNEPKVPQASPAEGASKKKTRHRRRSSKNKGLKAVI